MATAEKASRTRPGAAVLEAADQLGALTRMPLRRSGLTPGEAALIDDVQSILRDRAEQMRAGRDSDDKALAAG